MRTLLLLPLLVLVGCGSAGPNTSAVPLTQRDCVEAWNGEGNDEGRASVARSDFKVARVSPFIRISRFEDPTAEELESEGCSYLFHTDERYLTLSGTRVGDRIRWDRRATISGPWTSEQNAAGDDQARVETDGTLASLD